MNIPLRSIFKEIFSTLTETVYSSVATWTNHVRVAGSCRLPIGWLFVKIRWPMSKCPSGFILKGFKAKLYRIGFAFIDFEHYQIIADPGTTSGKKIFITLLSLWSINAAKFENQTSFQKSETLAKDSLHISNRILMVILNQIWIRSIGKSAYISAPSENPDLNPTKYRRIRDNWERAIVWWGLFGNNVLVTDKLVIDNLIINSFN